MTTSPPANTVAPETLAAIVDIVGQDNVHALDAHTSVSPASAAELSRVMAVASRTDVALVPIGNGTRSNRLHDKRPRLLLTMRRLHHVLHLDEVSLVVHVQAGLTGIELEKMLNARNLTLGDLPVSLLDSSIGGMLSVRTPGKSTKRHGTFEDAVLGVSAVLADGRRMHTRVAPRRASGPDLARVLCGSEGTLGIITAAELRIHRRPESRLLAAYRLPNFADALTAVRIALREEASPAAMRIYDGAQAKAHLDENCVDGTVLMLAATAGPTSLAACDRNLISSAVEAVGGTPTDPALAATWWNRRCGRESWPHSLIPTNLEVSATPRILAPVYDAVSAACTQANLRSQAHASRFDSDGGILFFTITDAQGIPVPSSSTDMVAIKDAAESAGAYLLERGNLGLSRYFESLRQALDPQCHLNPGVMQNMS